jgi:hypothetical protein
MFLSTEGYSINERIPKKTGDFCRGKVVGSSSGGGVGNADSTLTDRESEKLAYSFNFMNGGIKEGWEEHLCDCGFDWSKGLVNVWSDSL